MSEWFSMFNACRFCWCFYLSLYLYLSMPLQPFVGPWPLYQFLKSFYTVGETPWPGDEPVVRPLSAHRTAQAQNKRTQTSMSWVWFEPKISVFEPQTAQLLWSACRYICRNKDDVSVSIWYSRRNYWLYIWFSSLWESGRRIEVLNRIKICRCRLVFFSSLLLNYDYIVLLKIILCVRSKITKFGRKHGSVIFWLCWFEAHRPSGLTTGQCSVRISLSGHQLSWTRIFMIFPQTLQTNSIILPRFYHNSFHPDPFQFIGSVVKLAHIRMKAWNIWIIYDVDWHPEDGSFIFLRNFDRNP
jgi:hypothetical protein